MGRKFFVLLVIAGTALYSCKQSNSQLGSDDELAENAIQQQQDGTISLKMEKAETYHDTENPESNTAEWSVVVNKSGRYDIWLSSATKDTTDHMYENKVMLSIRDNMFETRPSVDKVIQNSSEVSLPYYRADSFIGSMYLQDTGVYNIQVISDKILPDDSGNGDSSESEETKLLSVSLTPAE